MISRKLLDVYAEEYAAIVKHLLELKENENEDPLINEEFIFVSKELLFSMFSKYPYEKNADKISTWSRLHFIESEKGRFTQKVYLKNSGRVRRIAISRKTFELVMYLKDKEI